MLLMESLPWAEKALSPFGRNPARRILPQAISEMKVIGKGRRGVRYN